MSKYVCVACGYLYDPPEDISANRGPTCAPPKRKPEEWVCPVCLPENPPTVSGEELLPLGAR